jgi:hypothetical protein
MSGLRERLSNSVFDLCRAGQSADEFADAAILALRQWLEDDEAVWLRVAAVLDPLAFDPDPVIRHQHCSPVGVDAVQGEALRLAKRVLGVIAAAPDALREGE